MRCAVIGLLLTMGAVAGADDAADRNWGHWRGPEGNGVSLTATPPVSWRVDGENMKWKVKIPGRGSGSPVVWEDKVFVTSAVPTGNNGNQSTEEAQPQQQEQDALPGRRQGRGRRGGRRGASLEELAFKVFCFSREDGKLLWEQTAITATPHQGTHSTNGFASASPCTDGEHVYAHFGSRGLHCYTMDGTRKWQRTDFPPMNTRNGFGEGSSPLLHEDRLILPWDHEGQSALYMINKQNGETIWKVERDEPTCWATPHVVAHNGKKQIIMNGQNYARSYDYETGEELWRCGGQTQRPAASPVSVGDRVFVGSGHRGSFLGAFGLDGRGDIEGSDQVAWTIERDTPDIASLLLSDNRLYFYKGRSGILTCVSAVTGKPLFSTQRVSGLDAIYASPIAANGHIYLAARNGTITVIKDSGTFEEVATNKMGETVDATPAPVGDQLFVRGEQHLFCIQAP